jgi:hypothetical protein
MYHPFSVLIAPHIPKFIHVNPATSSEIRTLRTAVSHQQEAEILKISKKVLRDEEDKDKTHIKLSWI